MINKPTSLGSILVAVLLVLMPAQPLLASVAVLNVQPGAGENLPPVALSRRRLSESGLRLVKKRFWKCC